MVAYLLFACLLAVGLLVGESEKKKTERLNGKGRHFK